MTSHSFRTPTVTAVTGQVRGTYTLAPEMSFIPGDTFTVSLYLLSEKSLGYASLDRSSEIHRFLCFIVLVCVNSFRSGFILPHRERFCHGIEET